MKRCDVCGSSLDNTREPAAWQRRRENIDGRSTAIRNQERADGMIFLQGVQQGRAFSFAINEQTGIASVAIAAQALSKEQVDAFNKAFSVCLEAKKYMVKY